MGVMGREVAAGQSWQIFFPAYTGQEPLFIYVTAALFKLAGANLFTLRLVSVGFGMVTVALAYTLGRSLIGPTVGLWAAALAATSFWHVLASRSSYRSIAQPAFEALTIYLLWRGWQRRSTPLMALTGVALGLTLYTYTAARLFPLAVAVCGLLLLWRAAADRRWLLTRFAVLIGAAVLTFAPLGLYFLRHPDQFVARAAQVSVASSYADRGLAWALLQSALDSIAMFWIRGDPTYRFNLAGKPIFDPLIGVTFTVGVVICLRRSRHPQYLLPVAVTLVMMLPSALSAEDTPHFLRSNGVMPFVFVIAGLGIVELWRWAWERRWVPAGLPAARSPQHAAAPSPLRTQHSGLRALRRIPHYAVPLATLLVVAEAASTAYAYFGPWAHARGTYRQLDTELVDAARYLQRVGGDGPVYVSAIFPRYPSVAFLAPQQFQRLRWFDGRECVVLDHDPAARYLFPESLGAPQAPGRNALEAIDTIPSGFGWPAFTVYQAKGNLAPSERTDATIGGLLQLEGVDVARRAAPGGSVPAASYWRVLGAPGEEVRLFSHLVGDNGQGAGASDFTCFYWTEWHGGETIVAGYDFSIPPTAAGLYHLELGLYQAASGERLPVTDAAGNPAGDQVRAGGLLVLSRPPGVPEPATPLDAVFDDGIRLAGATVRDEVVGSQSGTDVDLVWEATAQPAGDYTVFVQLLGPDGRVVAQADAQPRGGSTPTRVWVPGDRWPDAYRLDHPPLAAGDYTLIAGLYNPAAGGKRLAVHGDDARGDYVIVARPRGGR